MIIIMIVVTIIGIFVTANYFLIYTLGFFFISNSGSANAQLPGCFSLNIGLNMLPLDSFVLCLHSLLGYTGEFQALQLIVLAAFGAVEWPLLEIDTILDEFPLLEIEFKRIVGL